MHLALLTEKYPPDLGGLAISSARLAQLLTANGQCVQVFAPTTTIPPLQTQTAEHAGIVVHRIGIHRRTDDTLATWFEYLVAQHHQYAFDMLHAYFLPQAGFIAAYAGRYLGVPSVISARGNDLDRALFDPSKAAHILYALQHASAITTNAQDLARKAQALCGREVSVIPNGIDATHFALALRDDTLIRSLQLEGLSVVGFVGEARAKKGLAPLLVAFRDVAQQRPCALLLVGGVRDGDDANMVKIFQKQHPDLRLVVVPYVSTDTLPTYYNLLDVFVLPALRDGLPNALLEAMACECAIVATPVGGIPDAITDGVNGLLVPAGDAAALATAIHTLLDDAALRQQLGRNARETILREFTLQQELAGNLAIYRRVKHDD
jgi:glycosyltransferase involved in cell wall biosynthesis